MVLLGSKIELTGFEDAEPAHQVVIRKMVGTLAKKLEETKGAYDRLEVTRSGNMVSARALYADNTLEGSAEHENMFYAISGAFQQLLQ